MRLKNTSELHRQICTTVFLFYQRLSRIFEITKRIFVFFFGRRGVKHTRCRRNVAYFWSFIRLTAPIKKRFVKGFMTAVFLGTLRKFSCFSARCSSSTWELKYTPERRIQICRLFLTFVLFLFCETSLYVCVCVRIHTHTHAAVMISSSQQGKTKDQRRARRWT